MESVYTYIRGSDHYAPPTREVRGDYSNDGINHVPPQEAFIIIEILDSPSSTFSPSFFRAPSIHCLALSLFGLHLLSPLCRPFSAARAVASTAWKPPQGIPTLACLLSRNHQVPPLGGTSTSFCFLPRWREQNRGTRYTPSAWKVGILGSRERKIIKKIERKFH